MVILSLIYNLYQFTGVSGGKPSIKPVLTAAIDTCESRPGHFIIMWSLKQGSLGSILLSPCHCYHKVETGAYPLGYNWWQASFSDSVAMHNTVSLLWAQSKQWGHSVRKGWGVWGVLYADCPYIWNWQVVDGQGSWEQHNDGNLHYLYLTAYI